MKLESRDVDIYKGDEFSFLKLLFERLNGSGFDYCVLRNYEALPYSLGGSDLDLLVKGRDRDVIAVMVIDVAKECGGKLIAEYATTGRFMKFLGCCDGVWWGCAVDLLAGIDYRGMVYVSSERMLERTERYRGIKVAVDSDVEVMALLKEMVNNGRTRKDYFPNAAESYKKWGECSLDILTESMDKSLVEDFGQMLTITTGSDSKISLMAKRMRREIWKKHGISQSPSIIKNLLQRVKRIFNPPGICMAVTGTDGSGKTTLIHAIEPLIERAIHTEINYEHMRPNWLKALGVASGKRSQDSDAVTDPHGKPASGIVGSMARLSYYAMDYTMGYWLKVYPKLVKRVNICLFDRYYYDILLDPKRMRISLPMWLMKFFFLLAPQPRLLLCLGGDPSAIYKRKPETSLEEVEKQVKALKTLCETNKRAYWLDTTTSIEKTKFTALNIIMNVMAERY